MKKESKEKIEVFLTKENKERVRLKAKILGTSMAEIIKRALERYLS